MLNHDTSAGDGHGGRNNQSASEILHITRGLNDGGTGVHTVGTRQPVVQSQLAWRRATVLRSCQVPHHRNEREKNTCIAFSRICIAVSAQRHENAERAFQYSINYFLSLKILKSEKNGSGKSLSVTAQPNLRDHSSMLNKKSYTKSGRY